MAGDVVDPWLRNVWEGSEVVPSQCARPESSEAVACACGRVRAALLALARVGIDNGRVSPELLAAISATVAAVLAAVSLGLSTAREERKWRRESLVDTVVAFLDAGFDAPGELSMGKFRAGAYGKRDEEEHRRAHQRMLRALTRLRVLASAEVVSAAERVHSCDLARIQMLAMRQVPAEDWKRLGDMRNVARKELLASARRAMGLKPSAQINSQLMRIQYTSKGESLQPVSDAEIPKRD